MLLAAHRVHHRGLKPLTERQQLIVGAGAAGAVQNRDAVLAIEHRPQTIKVVGWRDHHGPGQQQAGDLGLGRVRGRLQRDVAGHHNDRNSGWRRKRIPEMTEFLE
jgi:hypothetical protein